MTKEEWQPWWGQWGQPARLGGWVVLGRGKWLLTRRAKFTGRREGRKQAIRGLETRRGPDTQAAGSHRG